MTCILSIDYKKTCSPFGALLILSFKTALCWFSFLSVVTLTYGSRAVIKFCAPNPSLNLDPSLEDLSTVDEEHLAFCESFAKLYLIGKVLGESVSLKSISSKMKAECKTLGESCFIDLGNDFFFIKFSTYEDCTKVWEERLFFIQKQVIVLQKMERRV